MNVVMYNKFAFVHTDGLIAQLLELCTSIAEVMVQIPFTSGFFSGFNFTTAQVVYNCNDQP